MTLSTMDPAIAVILRPLPRLRLPDPVVETAEIAAHDDLGGGNRRLLIRSEAIARSALPGQFVMVTIPDALGARFLLPRPIAIHRRRPDRGAFELVYRVMGAGTEALSRAVSGSRIEVVGPLGQPFRLAAEQRTVLLIGRGIGVCAFMTVAEEARMRGGAVTAVLSGRAPDAIIGLADAHELGIEALPVDDRSGTSAVEAVEARLEAHCASRIPDLILACGSNRLERLAIRLGRRWGAPVQLSVEAHMACGLGYCHGCALPGTAEPGREGLLACADGPVFAAGSADDADDAEEAHS